MQGLSERQYAAHAGLSRGALSDSARGSTRTWRVRERGAMLRELETPTRSDAEA